MKTEKRGSGIQRLGRKVEDGGKTQKWTLREVNTKYPQGDNTQGGSCKEMGEQTGAAEKPY